MVAYYENEAAVDAALKKAKTPEEVLKIAHDLEQRMAPHHWTQTGAAHGPSPLDTKGLGPLPVHALTPS